MISEDDEKFILYFNGERRNADAFSQVTIDSVTEMSLSFQIVFENTSIPDIKKKELRLGQGSIYVIQKHKTGDRVLKYKNSFSDLIGKENINLMEGNPVTLIGKTLAAVQGDKIMLSDGRSFTIKKIMAIGMVHPKVIIGAPVDAAITITYDDNAEIFIGKVPVEYEVLDVLNNESQFKNDSG